MQNSTMVSSMSEAIWENKAAGVGAFNGLGIQQAAGTGLANYISASLTYVAVDSTNLTLLLPVIPRGFICSLSAAGVLGVQNASVPVAVALLDGVTVLQQQVVQPAASGAAVQISFGIQWLVVGDGLTHTFSLAYKTTDATRSVVMFNDSATHVPNIIGQLTQSTFI